MSVPSHLRTESRRTTVRRYLSASIALVLLSAMLPAGAQDDIDEARQRREVIQADAAANAADLDALAAEDADLVAALADIDAWIAIQDAQLAAAEQELASNLEAEVEARARVEQLNQQIEQLGDALAEQLVNGYIEGFGGDSSLILSANDINAVPVLRFVLDESSGVSADATDQLRSARQLREDAIVDAEEASVNQRLLRDDIEQRLSDLDDTRANQEELRAEVTRRIALLEDEADELAAADAEVERFIQAELARIAAEEEAARLAAEAEARQVAAEEAARVAAVEEAQRVADAQVEADRLAAEEATAAEAAAEAAEAAGPGDEEPETTTEAEPEPEPEPQGGGEAPNFSRPIPGRITSGFGYRIHPVYGTGRLHTGVDMRASSGAPIGSAAPGTVIFAGVFGGYGNAVIVAHTGGYSSLYAHMSAINVSKGATVSAGTTVGLVGSTGVSTGAHLHFEIRLNGTAIDPAPFI